MAHDQGRSLGRDDFRAVDNEVHSGQLGGDHGSESGAGEFADRAESLSRSRGTRSGRDREIRAAFGRCEDLGLTERWALSQVEADGVIVQPTRAKKHTTFKCRFDCEDGLPPISATAEQLEEYQQRMLRRGKK